MVAFDSARIGALVDLLRDCGTDPAPDLPEALPPEATSKRRGDRAVHYCKIGSPAMAGMPR